MLFLGMLSKVKLFIERDTQRSLRDIEESKHHFKVKLDALEAQKRKEKLMFSRAINTLRKLYQTESSSLKNDHSKIIERLSEQIQMLTEIRETYDTKIIQLKELSSGGNDVKEE